MSIDSRLIGVAIAQLPNVIQFIKDQFAKDNPGVPPPTSEQVIAGLSSAILSSLTKSETWLAAHPKETE